MKGYGGASLQEACGAAMPVTRNICAAPARVSELAPFAPLPRESHICRRLMPAPFPLRPERCLDVYASLPAAAVAQSLLHMFPLLHLRQALLPTSAGERVPYGMKAQSM